MAKKGKAKRPRPKKGSRKSPAARKSPKRPKKPKKATPKKPAPKKAPPKKPKTAPPKKPVKEKAPTEPPRAKAAKPAKPRPPTIRSFFDNEQTVCALEFLSDGRAFIARVNTIHGGMREHRAPAFMDLLELVAEDLREEFLEM